MKSLLLSSLSSLTLLLGFSSGVINSKVESAFHSLSQDSFLGNKTSGKKAAWELIYASGSFSYLSRLINQLQLSTASSGGSPPAQEKNDQLLLSSSSLYPEKLKQLTTSFFNDLSWTHFISPIEKEAAPSQASTGGKDQLTSLFPAFKSKFLSLNSWIEASILSLTLTSLSSFSLLLSAVYLARDKRLSQEERIRELFSCLAFQLPGWLVRYFLNLRRGVSLKTREVKAARESLFLKGISGEPDISIRGLNYSIGKEKILKNINLQLKKGEFYSIIGSNGAGKTTLMKHIGKIINSQEGELSFSGKSLSEIKEKEYWRKVVYIPQELNIQLDTPVYDFLLYSRYLFLGRSQRVGIKDKLRVLNAIRKCQLQSLRWESMGSLSGGQRQKVILASILLKDAELILLDEPTTFLDVDNRNFLISFFRELHSSGKTIIANLHKFSEIAQLSTRVIALKEGRVEREGEAEKVLQPSFLNRLYDWELTEAQWGSLMKPSESNY